MPTRRRFLIGSACSLSAVAWPALALGGEGVATGGPAFGTYWRAVLPAGTDMRPVTRAVAPVIELIDRSMSPYRADSELSRFNASGPTDTFSASPELSFVAGEALRIAAETRGAFDPTVGPAVHRYGFGPITGTRGHYTDIAVDPGRLSKAGPGLTLDLCGIAKGHALDLMGAALVAEGHQDFFLELGGEVLAHGRHPADRTWRAGIEDPAGSGLIGAVAMEERALATSGRTAQNYALNHRTFTHIIDPATGSPARGDLAAVTVLASTARQADAHATALFAMGAKRGVVFAERHHLPALFLEIGAAGITRTVTAGFADHLIETGEPS